MAFLPDFCFRELPLTSKISFAERVLQVLLMEYPDSLLKLIFSSFISIASSVRRSQKPLAWQSIFASSNLMV